MNIGSLRHRVTLAAPSRIQDNDGGYTEAWTALTPSPVWAAIEPATARNLERVVGNAVQATATHLVTVRYHSGITTRTRLTLGGSRYLYVRGVQDLDERGIGMTLACEEVVS
jgi:SPP1 family predicted phage head-tail adaptor